VVLRLAGARRSMPQMPLPQRTPDRRTRFQRILKEAGDGPSGPYATTNTIRTGPDSQQLKASALSPELVNPASVSSDEEVMYQCNECDMVVKASDTYCPFCGSVFADAGVEDTPVRPIPHPEPLRKEEIVVPERFNLFELMETSGRYREMLYEEAGKGFAGSARLLEDIERMISTLSSLGTDTTHARRLVRSAWEACRDGNWNMASALARQTEDYIAPSIPELVRAELSRAREILAEAKVAGADISGYVTKIKSAAHALHMNDQDEALRLTKELLDSLREDSISWG